MVRIRLRRTGAKNNPAYRVVVADQNSPRDGAFIETIGHYLPTRQPAVVEIDEGKAQFWLSKGAQPSETVASLLRHKGILPAKTYVAPASSPASSNATETQTVTETEAAPATEAATDDAVTEAATDDAVTEAATAEVVTA